MNLTVVFRETALHNLARIRSENEDLFIRTRRACASLADEPFPDGVVAWGSTGVYRLHAGDIRVLYEIDDETATVYVINIGVIALFGSRRPAELSTAPGNAGRLAARR